MKNSPNPSLRPATSLLALALALAGPLLLGCGPAVQGTIDPITVPAGMKGRVIGGQQPVSGSTIKLWAVNTNGAAATSLLSSAVISDAGGNFSITSDYTCPSASTQVYLTANGGNPGLAAGTNNGAIAMMAALGSCGNLTSSTFISLNEVTTVASVWALQQFLGVTYGTPFAESIGTSTAPQSAIGMANAFMTVPNLVNLSNGTATSGAANAIIETTRINTIANILASCINSDGTTACQTLFNAVKPSGSTAPADTLQAALYMATNPANNVAAIYALQGSTPPFQPALTAAPFDWTLAITYYGSPFNAPYFVAVDANGSIWVTNAAGSSSNGLLQLTPAGQPVAGTPFLTGSGTPLSGPQSLVIDTTGDIWVANHGSGSNSLVNYAPSSNTYSKMTATGGCLPQAMAIDGSNNALFTCSGITNLFGFPNTGDIAVPSYPSSTVQYGAIGTTAEGMAIDPTGNVWVASNGSNNVSKFGTGDFSSAIATYPVQTAPFGIAIDHSGSAWVANGSGGTVGAYNINRITSGGTSSVFTGGGLSGPRYIAVDGKSNVWVANATTVTVSGTTYVSASEFSNTGVALSPALATGIPGGFAHASGAGSPQPRGIAIDPSGNVWMTGCASGCTNYSFILELVGAAAPVVTPISVGIANNQLGCCSFTPPPPGTSAPAITPGSLSLQTANFTPMQPDTSFDFQVSRSGGSTGAVSVTYTTSDGSAIAGTDYTTTSGTLTWADGDTSIRTVTVPFLDSSFSGSKTFSLTLSSPTNGATLYPVASTLITVTDPAPLNPIPGNLTLQTANFSAVQNNGSFSFLVSRNGGSVGAVSVNYATSDGTATAGTDYTATSGTLSWAAGDISLKTITVPFIQTANYSGTRTFNLTLSNPTNGATVGPVTNTLVSVTDNLTPPSTQFNFAPYKLGLPIDIYGGTGGVNSIQFASATIQPAQLQAGFSDPYFYLSNNKVVFVAPSNGATTSPGSGSDHTRSELRELYTASGNPNSDWNSTIGGTLTASCTIQSIAAASDEVTLGQIHGQTYVFMLLIYRPAQKDIAVDVYTTNSSTSGHTRTSLVQNVNLGDTINYSIQYIGNTITVVANGKTLNSTIDSSWAGTDVYFKLGAYHAVANTGNPAGDKTQVTFSSFNVTH